ncbi:SRPBCC domain-containing protein [Haladaptatus pallidirubidus]|uniref:SRPBCC domain-containing protein n=1 Tax=Haladaptatus pallidirubidus TaxID=1008152 RepID=A0AAV3UHB7_9EURY|nr:SRPBCC domain-containing protein [Haladaptatus pallidirubidus]
MIETDETSLTIQRAFDAPRERVFRAFIEPKELKEWFAPAPGDVTTEVQTFAPEPNGERSIRFHTDDGWFGSNGAFEEVIENERIVYTDRWVNFPEAEVDSRVIVEFFDAKEGTEIVLTHEQLPDGDAVGGAGMGWENSLGNLAEVLVEP